jgi:hypothetical protein
MLTTSSKRPLFSRTAVFCLSDETPKDPENDENRQKVEEGEEVQGLLPLPADFLVI